MKKFTLSLLLVFLVGFTAKAQQISVVAPTGQTQIFTDLNLAIQGAQAGSTIYLSGGGFQVNDSVKITKKLTIIGIGHRPDNDNADGNTNVSGNLHFHSGSNGSSVMGIYLSGNINIGNADAAVNNFLLRFCNVNSVQMGNAVCQGVVINQNYLRNPSNGGGSALQFSNNILHSIDNINGGVITHNVIKHNVGNYYGYYGLRSVNNSQIRDNILRDPSAIHSGSNCIVNNNMLSKSWGENSIVVEDWDEEFEGPDNGVNPTSNFKLKATSQGINKASDGTDIGVYGGTGFSDTALPPGPRIVDKRIASQTDANGKLLIQIEVQVGD